MNAKTAPVLDSLREKIDQEILELAPRYPFLINGMNKKKYLDGAKYERDNDKMALDAILKIRESLSLS